MDIRRILIDTSILVGYLKRKEKENTILYNLYQSCEDMCVSAITVFEVFYGCDPEHAPLIAQLFEGFTIIPFDAEVARVASQEYQRLKDQQAQIEVRELVLGATAIAKDIPLATLNAKPFKKLSNIKIVF